MADKKFVLDLSLSVTLELSQIWPDGDAPENPTPEDVVAVLHSCGSDLLDVLHDWGLSEDADLTVMDSPRDPNRKAHW